MAHNCDHESFYPEYMELMSIEFSDHHQLNRLFTPMCPEQTRLDRNYRRCYLDYLSSINSLEGLDQHNRPFRANSSLIHSMSILDVCLPFITG